MRFGKTSEQSEAIENVAIEESVTHVKNTTFMESLRVGVNKESQAHKILTKEEKVKGLKKKLSEINLKRIECEVGTVERKQLTEQIPKLCDEINKLEQLEERVR